MNRPFIAEILAGSLPRLRDPLDPETAVSRRRSRLRGDHIVDTRVDVPEILRNAAVLVPLIDHPGSMNVLLTQRTAGLPHHAGQSPFPAGGWTIRTGIPSTPLARSRRGDRPAAGQRRYRRPAGRLHYRHRLCRGAIVGFCRTGRRLCARPVGSGRCLRSAAEFLHGPGEPHARNQAVERGSTGASTPCTGTGDTSGARRLP